MIVLFSIRVVFLLFKQKTAYEMRIIDLSSDVFSSDLGWVISITVYPINPPIYICFRGASQNDAPELNSDWLSPSAVPMRRTRLPLTRFNPSAVIGRE